MSEKNGRDPAGVTVRQAALIAGIAYLLNPVSYAEFALYPKLVVPHDIAQTVANISSHGTMFGTAILCYLINFIEDLVIAWALYVLLAPVNRALSVLTAWFRLLYTAMGLVAVMQLAIAYRLILNPHHAALGSSALQTQVELLLSSFRYGWNFSLVVFGMHLILLGYLIYRSNYIPKLLGVVLAIVGIGWIVDVLQPFFYPTAQSRVDLHRRLRRVVAAALVSHHGLEDPARFRTRIAATMTRFGAYCAFAFGRMR